MPLKYNLSGELGEILGKLFRKDRERYEIVLKKMEEISSRSEAEIEYYKNLKYNMKDFKRVHIDKSFVLLFKFFKKEKTVLFYLLLHHDDVYKR